MKGSRLDLLDCFVYFLLMMAVHRLSTPMVTVINSFAKTTLQLPWSVREPMNYMILAAIPHLAFVWLAYRAADKQYRRSDDRWLSIKTGMLYMVPGELIRLAVGATSVNTVVTMPWKFGIAYAPVNHLIFTATYGKWSGRAWELSFMGEDQYITYIPQDYLAYIACHLLCLIPYMAVQLLIYSAMWKLAAHRHAKMPGEI